MLILFGMFIQKRCYISKRKKRVNELEDENNDFDNPEKNDYSLYNYKIEKNKKENINNNYNIN